MGKRELIRGLDGMSRVAEKGNDPFKNGDNAAAVIASAYYTREQEIGEAAQKELLRSMGKKLLTSRIYAPRPEEVADATLVDGLVEELEAARAWREGREGGGVLGFFAGGEAGGRPGRQAGEGRAAAGNDAARRGVLEEPCRAAVAGDRQQPPHQVPLELLCAGEGPRRPGAEGADPGEVVLPERGDVSGRTGDAGRFWNRRRTSIW